VPGISASLGLPWRSITTGLHSFKGVRAAESSPDFSYAALLGREAQLLQHRGHTRGIHGQSYSPANRRNALVKAILSSWS